MTIESKRHIEHKRKRVTGIGSLTLTFRRLRQFRAGSISSVWLIWSPKFIGFIEFARFVESVEFIESTQFVGSVESVEGDVVD